MPHHVNSPIITFSNYQNWSPIRHTIIKDEALTQTIHEKGYAVIPFLNSAQLNELKELYAQEHTISAPGGAMFYSLYSKNHEYRNKIHNTISTILQPLFDLNFKDYKNVVNIFINKLSGPESGFYTHQDTTALDEFKHSPLSIWIPLQDIDAQNGALGVIEKSHWFFSPYRGVSFPFPFSGINDVVKSYLKPIYLKAGEALVFDPRVVHNSFANHSGNDRLVVLSGLFPKNAELQICYKEKTPESEIELIHQEDSFLLENDSFYYDCHSRPKSGKVIAKIKEPFPDMDANTFEALCKANSIEKALNQPVATPKHCEFIAEPNGIYANHEIKETKNFFQKIKAFSLKF